VITGAVVLTVKTRVADPVPLAFVALIFTLEVAAVVGVPDIKPDPLTFKPAGRPLAPKLVGLLVAEI
jgi:hypothetical protein